MMVTFKRRFLAAVMAVLTVMSCFAGMTFSASAESSGDFEYEVLDDETVRITGYSGSDTDVVIPAEIEGKKVTGIGEYAFGYGNMQTVSIPDGVTSIGNGAFYNCSLKTVSLPAGIKNIGESAFELCQSLTDITIPDGVTGIGASAFNSCESLTNISIPANVESIDGNVFVGCMALASITVDKNNVSYKSEDGVLFNKDMTQIITYPNKHGSEYAIPDGIETIGAGAFSGCDNLDEISMPDSVTDIGSDAFSGCVALTDISLSDSVESIGEYAFAGCSGLTEIIMPDSITDIGANAFASCASLATVMLSDSITEIGDYVFEGCELLDDISIPDGVTRIGEYAFASCTSLESISLPSELTDIGACAFASCSSLEEVVIPENVESIGREAFANCDMLDSVDVPDSVTEIGAHAFGFMYESDPSSILRYKCVLKEDFTLICSEGSAAEDYAKENNIDIEQKPEFSYSVNDDKTVTITGYNGSDTVVVIPAEIDEKKVTSISVDAFSGCESLTDITISDGITEIGASAFAYCKSLTNISIPASVESIDEDVFIGCIELASITVDEGNAFYKSEDGVLFNKDMTQIITYPNKHGSEYVIPDGVAKMGEYAFSSCESLTNISIPASVESIDGNVFRGCIELASITVDESNAFYKSEDGVLFNKDMTQIIIYPNKLGSEYVIPDGVVKIGDFAFAYCESLTNISIPASVTSIGRYAFDNCSLEKVILLDGFTNIGEDMFSFCTSLTNISIPASVTSIGSRAFYSCESLVSINIPASVTSIGDSAFSGCESLTEITIPDGVKTIGAGAFSGCDDLTEISIPASVISIGEYAFSHCESLTNISIPASVESIDGNVFCGCIELASITVDESNAFYKSEDGVLFNKDMTQIITYPNKHGSEYVIPDSVETINDSAFWKCTGLTSVTIPDSVETIGDDAFDGCTGLTDIIIPDSVKTIGDHAFLYCTGLTSITIPGSVETIGDFAFELCGRLTSITIAGGVEAIGVGAFRNCTGLTNVTIPKSVTEIGEQAFGFHDVVEIDVLSCIQIDDFVIYGYTGTAAEKYANDNGFEFIGLIPCSHSDIGIKHEKSATCVENGYSGDKYCKKCGELIESGTEIAALGHKYVNGVCSVCGDIYMDSKNELTSKSEQIKVNNETKQAVYTPASSSGMKVSEFKQQFDGEISIDMDDNALVVNGTKFKFGDSEFTVIVKGDVQPDGKITASDARTILRISAKLDKADDAGMSAADVNGDGKVTAGEARRVLRFSAKLEKSISN